MADDYAAGTSTTGTVSVNGSITGNLTYLGDHDWFKIYLTAGQSVTISMFGSGSSAATDPYLQLYNSSGTNVLASNDDTGGTLNSKVVFTPTSSGYYYIDAAAYQDSNTTIDEYLGTYTVSVRPYTPPPLASVDQIANQLVNGYWNAQGGDTYHHFNVSPGGTLTVNLTGLTAAEKNLALTALGTWSDIIGVTFKQVSTGGQIVFDDSEDSSGDPVAETIDNWSNATHITTSANVHISTSWVNRYGTGINSYSLQTYIHEIGHALGLGHAGDYNGTADFASDSLFENDAWPTSIMSYFSQADNPYFASEGFTENFALTPMIADIVAMQKLYGLSTTTRTDNTTYGFNSNAGNIYNAAIVSDAVFTIFDSRGVDTIDYSGSAANQLIDLNPETFSNVNGQTGNLSIARGVVIENAIGGNGNDTLIGNAANNTLDGRGGANTVSYETATAGVTVNMALATAQNTVGAGTDKLVNFTTLIGSDFNDVLTGGSDANAVIHGGAGNDKITAGSSGTTLFGDAGDDTFLLVGSNAQKVSGGSGLDTLDLSAFKQGVTLHLTDGSQDVGGGVIVNLESIEQVVGTAFGDHLIASGAGQSLAGGGGDDVLDARSADGAKLAGGAGNDTYFVDSATDKLVEKAGEGVDLVNASVSYVLGANLDNLTLTGTTATRATGNALANVLHGNDANNVLDGGAGADRLYGGAGDDSYVVDNAGDRVAEAAGEGLDLVKSSVTFELGSNVENLTLTGVSGINGTGNSADNLIKGNSAGNVLNGGAGGDRFYGGAGNDTYVVDDAGDRIAEASGQGTDLVKSSVSFKLGSNVENLTLTGTAAISGTGNSMANVLYGNSAANLLNGGTGADRFYGGGGNDTYIVDNAGDRVSEASGKGIDLVKSSVSFGLASNVDNLTLTGSAAINGTGNSGSNVIIGNSAANIINGGAGADHLTGGAGADTFVFNDGHFGGMTAATCDDITDFTGGDQLDLHLVDANSLASGDQAFAFIGSDAFHDVAGELRYEQVSGDTFVYGDTNGDGIADFMIRLDGTHVLTGADIGI